MYFKSYIYIAINVTIGKQSQCNLIILDEFKKIAILKKGIGIESQNLCKQFNDQKTLETR